MIHHTRPDGTAYPASECRAWDAFRTGKGTRVDDEVLWRKDGSSFPAEYWSHPIVRDGSTIGAVVTFVDITERKKVEAALREREQWFRAIFEGARPESGSSKSRLESWRPTRPTGKCWGAARRKCKAWASSTR